MMTPTEIKAALFEQCKEFVEARLQRVTTAMKVAQAAANEGAKSSMGDKYETTRAMMHLETEKLSGQLAEANKLKMVLGKVVLKTSTAIQLGSLVRTQTASYFIAISMGKAVIEDNTYFVVSPASPIGKLFLGKKKGETVTFNGRKFTIEAVN